MSAIKRPSQEPITAEQAALIIKKAETAATTLEKKIDSLRSVIKSSNKTVQELDGWDKQVQAASALCTEMKTKLNQLPNSPEIAQKKKEYFNTVTALELSIRRL